MKLFVNLFLYKRLFLSYLLLKRIDKAKKLIEDNKTESADIAGFEDYIEEQPKIETVMNEMKAAGVEKFGILGFCW